MHTAELQSWVVTQLDDLKAKQIKELDVQALTSITDVMIICSGTSSRHVKAIADNLTRESKKAGILVLGVEGTETAEWILVDMDNIVVHIMQPVTRDLYQLEKLWDMTIEPTEQATEE